nr:RNA-directed DNA polymerase, eukaryota [Tanacetum cinerariifolium]
MGKPVTNTDSNGWTWVFRNNKTSSSKPIHNPYQRDMEKVATSFYVTNFRDSIDSRGLWNICTSYGRLVDAFITTKRSKEGKRFGFIRFIGVNNASSLVRSLPNIWIGNFHLYVSIAMFQRPNKIISNLDPKPRAPINETMDNPNPNPKNISCNNTDVPAGNPSFASIVHASSKSSTHLSQTVKPRPVSLVDQDLINIEDATKVLLVKIKEIESTSHMYQTCKNKGFIDVKIHHVSGLWIWIQFPTSEACVAFQSSESMKRIYSSIKKVSPSFKVDDRLVWIEINGLPLCAWGSNAFKKVVCLFGKFMFFKADQTAPMCSGRVCISTKTHKFISEKVDVKIHGENFEVQVQELVTWSIDILYDSQELESIEEESEVEKVVDSFDDNVADDLEDIIKDLKEDKEEEEAIDKISKDECAKFQEPLHVVNSPDPQPKRRKILQTLVVHRVSNT